jgi:hypothetical protein
MADETQQNATDEEESRKRDEEVLQREAEARRKQEHGRREAHATEALVVDLGRRCKRDVDRLRKGRGPLMDDVEDCLEDLRAAGDLSQSVQPLIIVVKERPAFPAPAMPFFLPGFPLCPFGRGREEDDDGDEEED